jgi:hypothetical protein
VSEAGADTDPDRERIRNVDDLPRDWRELLSFLARVDSRSLEMHLGLARVSTEASNFRSEVRGNFTILGSKIEGFERAIREVPALARRAADESGEHTQQQLVNMQGKLLDMRDALAEKDRRAAEIERDEARKEVARLRHAEVYRVELQEKDQRRDAEDLHRRKRALVFSVAGAGLAGVATHLLHVLHVLAH